MNKLLQFSCVALVSAFCTTAQAEVNFAEDFFTDEVKSCGYSNVNSSNLDFVNELLTVTPDRLYNSGSLTVKWNYIGDRVLRNLDMAYRVASEKDETGAIKILDFLENVADNNLFYGWDDWEDIKDQGRCWKGPNGKCPYHHPEFVAQFFTGILISANILDEYIWPEQREKFDRYFSKMYKKFIKPKTWKNDKSGFYAGANYGIGNLAYARWTRDSELLLKEIKHRKKVIKKHFRKDGWVENNSWRGNRDYWYHTLAVDTVLGYMLIARANGFDLFNDPVIGPRVFASIEKTVLGNQSLKEFSKKGYKGNNHITGSKKARPHMHQESTNLVEIVSQEYGILINPRHEHFRRQKGQENINFHVGFNAKCYYRS